ncbi:MAG: AraC family transcriptional regulator [Duganella sp.]
MRFKRDTPLTQTDSLAELVGKIAEADGSYPTAIASLRLYRRDATSEPLPCIYGMGLGLTVQGEKRVTLGSEIFDYGVGQSLVTSIDLPVVTYVSRACSDEPFLALWLELDAQAVAQVAAQMQLALPSGSTSLLGMSVVTLDDGLQRALLQMLRLLDEPALIPLLEPLIQHEIIVRLLSGEHGPALRRLVMSGSPSQQIAKAVSWLKQHFRKNFPIDELALQAHMSPSTFRLHFRRVVGMSPLQYLKQLRLQDARQLMLNEHIDAGSAAVRVGYESASQFSREYTRLFGAPPVRDIRRLQQGA